MQPKGWKNFLLAIVITTNGVVQIYTNVDKAWAKNSHGESSSVRLPPKNLPSKVTSLTSELIADQQCQQLQQDVSSAQVPELRLPELAKLDDSQGEKCFDKFSIANRSLQLFSKSEFEASAVSAKSKDYLYQQSIGLKGLYSQLLPDSTQPPTVEDNSQPSPTLNQNVGDLQTQNDPPPLEAPPGTFPNPSLEQREQLLDSPQTNYDERREELRRILQQTQSSPSTSNPELGLRIRPRTLPQSPIEQQPLPTIEKPVVQFKPLGYLQARVGYFNSSNIFSASVDPVEDSLIFYGLTLASAYFPLGSNTYITGSIDGNQIYYLDQSIYNYNQLRFNLSLYRQLSQRMYGEISWSNQLLFYANNGDNFKAGDRFLNENSIRLSLGRRDPLTTKLVLDSFYELSLNLSDPENRSRIINSFWLSLSYLLQKPLQVGINYQLNLSDFTNRPDSREDEFHRLFGHLTYRVSTYSNLNLQGGVSFGDSNAPNIDFDGWFFSLNYSWNLGQF